MTNKFNITVVAKDDATKTLAKINKKVGSIFRPWDNAKKSVGAFFSEVGRNDVLRRATWTLEKVGSGVTAFGSAFGVAENSVIGGSARIASALGMIGGPVGGFLAAGTALVGGAAAVSVQMANMGLNISRTAKNLNVSTDELQEWRGAAKQAGLQTEVMDSSILNLGMTLQDSLAGRNMQVATLMKHMGVNIKTTKDGAVDTLAAMRDVADVVSHMQDQNMARKLTDMLGITELLPLLREGSGKIDEYLRKQQQLGIQTKDQIKFNEDQAQSWNETKTAMDSAGVAIGNVIAQYLNLKTAADSATKVAMAMQNGNWGAVLKQGWANIWNNSPETYFLRKIFGEVSDGSSTGGATGSWSDASKVTGTATNVSSTSPIGIRQNNPGNLRSWPGAGSAGGFASFGTPQAGLTAMATNLTAYQDKHGINTLSGIVNRWAPPSENNTGAYIADLSRQTGFSPDQALDLHDPKVLAPLMSAITKHENNGQNPYSPEQLAQAIAMALKDSQGGERPITVVVQNVPQGLTVKPVRGLGAATVGLAMAPGGMS